MSDATQLSKDLSFVRGLVDPDTRRRMPRGVLWVLAGLLLVGVPLPDFVGQGTVLKFWLFAGTTGFLTCAFLSARAMRRSGQEDLRTARRQFAHWAAFFAMVGLAVLLPRTGTVTWESLAPILLLLVSCAYLMAAIHLDLYMIGPGLAFAVGYGLLVYRVAYAWTIMGVLGAIALVLSAELNRPTARTRAEMPGPTG